MIVAWRVSSLRRQPDVASFSISPALLWPRVQALLPLCLFAYTGDDAARTNVVARATREALASFNARGALVASLSAVAQLLSGAGAPPAGPARAAVEALAPSLQNVAAVLNVMVRQGPMAPAAWVEVARRCLDLVHVVADPHVLVPCCQLLALALDAVPALMHGRGVAKGCV